MPIFPIDEYIQVGGKLDIYLAFSPLTFVAPDFPFAPVRENAPGAPISGVAAYNLLFKLGEADDETRPSNNANMGNVSGDRYGGREGPPIEKQFNGISGTCRLRLSRWDVDVLRLIKNRGGLAPGGFVPLTSFGALCLRDRSFRMVLRGIGNAKFRFNYPCCICEDAIEMGMGTKHSLLEFTVSAHRAPEGHWAAPATGTDLVTGYTENLDMTGYTT